MLGMLPLIAIDANIVYIFWWIIEVVCVLGVLHILVRCLSNTSHAPLPLQILLPTAFITVSKTRHDASTVDRRCRLARIVVDDLGDLTDEELRHVIKTLSGEEMNLSTMLKRIKSMISESQLLRSSIFGAAKA